MTPRRKIIIAVAVFIGISLLLAIYAAYRAAVYTATIEITFAPRSASVTIGGHGASAGKNHVRPGKHQVVISREGFAEYKTEVEAIKDQTVLVEAVLRSNDPSTANWYDEHPEDYELAQGIGDRADDRAREEVARKMPIMKDLPLNGLYSSYSVTLIGSPTKQGEYALNISYRSEAAKQQAVQAIRDKGYKLEDYEVLYDPESTIVNNVLMPGLIVLSERGYDKAVVDTVADSLTRTYATYRGEKVVSIAFADDATHVVDNDADKDTLSVTITINEDYKRRLVITRTGSTPLAVTTTALDGSDSQRVY